MATNWSNIKYLVVGVKGVSLKDWLDNSTLTIGETFKQLRNESSEPIMYELTIAAKKVMPTAANIPDEYKFIWKPDYDPTVSKVLTVYPVAVADALNPKWDNKKFVNWLNGESLKDEVAEATWDALAKSGERMIEDYVSGEILTGQLGEAIKEFYSFTFAGLPTGGQNGNATSAAYLTDWNAATALKGGNTVIEVLPAAIGNGYATNLNFTFKNISGTKDSQGWTDKFDYSVAAQSFTTQFKNAVDLLTYTTEYSYKVYEVDANGNLVKDEDNNNVYTTAEDNVLYVKWTDVADGETVVDKYYTMRWTRTDGRIKLNDAATLKSLIVSNITDANKVLAQDAGIEDFDFNADAKLNLDNPATEAEDAYMTFKFTGNLGKYIEPAEEEGDLHNQSDGTSFKFKKKGGAANPTENMSGTIVISGYDTFGKKHDFTFPVVILFNE